MTDLLIKLLVALLALLVVPTVLCVSCIIVVGLWTLCHWPKGGWEDD